MKITIKDLGLRPAGGSIEGQDPNDLLKGTITIGGIDHHVEAFRVTLKKGMTKSASGHYDEVVEGICDRCSGPPETITVERRKYIVMITPYAK